MSFERRGVQEVGDSKSQRSQRPAQAKGKRESPVGQLEVCVQGLQARRQEGERLGLAVSLRQVCQSAERSTVLVSFGIDQIKLQREGPGGPHVLTPQAITATVKPRGFQRNVTSPLRRGRWESADHGPGSQYQILIPLAFSPSGARWLRFPRKSRSGAAWPIVDPRQAGLVFAK